jgi:hypothetical protein
MMHILTVHWKSDEWIDLQLGFLNKFTDQPFETYAAYTGIAKDRMKGFTHSFEMEEGQHAIKLNTLAKFACERAESPDDILVFLDGDAFPIKPMACKVKSYLKSHPLVAVQRLENNGDIQPHPCFCATTVGFWEKIKGDWQSGYKWPDASGRMITDVGGNLLDLLDRTDSQWKPLHRSSTLGSHKVYFGVYDDFLYHHTAGFRTPVCREDRIAHPMWSKLEEWIPNRIWFGVFRHILLRRKIQKVKEESTSIIAVLKQSLECGSEKWERLMGPTSKIPQS